MRKIQLAAMLLITFVLSIPAGSQTIIKFDVARAGSAAGQGTFPIGISPARVIIGYAVDAAGTYHGFVRSKDGTTTALDVPSAGTSAGQGTVPWSINVTGTITGDYVDASGLAHGFVFEPNGGFTIFDAPGAGNVGACASALICSNGTQGASINADGVISGQYADTNGVFHGFMRSPNGAMTPFDAPAAGTAPGQGTLVTFGDGISPAGAIAGGYTDATGQFHGFVRTPDGAITSFDPPSSIFTNNSGINAAGTITSFYADASSAFHGYVRAKDGTFTFFDVSGSGAGANQGTLPFNINAAGDIVGEYIDNQGVSHGFLRLKTGAITGIDVPGAGNGSGQGTVAIGNSPANAITGWYVDAGDVAHGFLRMP